jgi:hypothetical protein
MSVNNLLNTMIRPTVKFNAENREHRYWAHQFITNRTWRGCPFVFALPQSEDNVYNMVLRHLAEWYSNKEFAVVEMPQEKVVPIGIDRRQG